MKTVIQVWTQNCSNLRRNNYDNYWGIGDLIRGTIKLYQLSKKMNFRLIVNIKHHPISNFLKQTYIEYEDLITQNINNILFITPNNVENYINNSSDNIIYFLTNDLCDENNIPICIYVGLVILLFIIGMLIYKFYNNKENSGLDCPIGFCNMNDEKETQ